MTGRLTESLGGVRVVKGFHAEGREAAVFEAGAIRLFPKRATHAFRELDDRSFIDVFDGHRQRNRDGDRRPHVLRQE